MDIWEKCAEIAKGRGAFEVAEEIMRTEREYMATQQTSEIGPAGQISHPVHPLAGDLSSLFGVRTLTRKHFENWYSVHNGVFKNPLDFWNSFFFTFKGMVIE